MIRWDFFIIVIVSSLVAAGLLVTLFSLALRFGDGVAPWRRTVSIVMYVLCGAGKSCKITEGKASVGRGTVVTVTSPPEDFDV